MKKIFMFCLAGALAPAAAPGAYTHHRGGVIPVK